MMIVALAAATLATVTGSPWDPISTSMRRLGNAHTHGGDDPNPVDNFRLHMHSCTTDHFGYTDLPPFDLRVFINDTYWDRDNAGPIFLYTGNEASITEFIKNTGIMLEIAPEFKAMVVFVEHRYYGDSWTNGSWPFGTNAFQPENLRYLTVEQALADFVEVTLSLRELMKAPPETAVVTFGGSYGANLAMWSRLKTPNVFAGAIASSVSVQKHLLRTSNAFWMIVTDAYKNVSATCPKLIRAGWDEIDAKASTASGRKDLQAQLNLCDAPASAEDAQGLAGWYNGALETMVQYGYPYPTSFYNPVPGYPFKVACEAMVKDGTPLGALKAAAEVYYNYSGQAGKCFAFGGSLKNDVASGDAPPSGWGYQTCTEVYQPTPSNGLYPAPGGDMFPPSVPNKTAIFDDCRSRYGVVPRPDWEEIHFGGPNIGAGSNIFLSAGQVDPWRAAGIPYIKVAKGTQPPASIEIHENLMGAHHLDIRATNPLDPPSVVECRTKQQAAMRRWIAEWKANPPLPITGGEN